MKLGFASAILPDVSFTDMFAFAGSTGFDCVEVMCWPPSKAERRYAGVTHINIADCGDADIALLLETCQQNSVSISALGYYPNLLSADASESQVAIEHLMQLIAFAPRLGVNHVNTFIGRDHRLSVDENWPRMLEVWKPIIRHAESHQVRIGIENCPMSFSKDEWPGGKNLAISPAIWDRLFNDLPSDFLGLNYDPSHMIWQQMDAIAPITAYSEKLFHVHAKDVRIDRVRLNQVGILAHPNDYHTPKLPGLGDVNWGHFFSALTDTGYSGAVCVEVEDRAYEGTLENRQRSLVQSHTYLRNFIPRLA